LLISLFFGGTLIEALRRWNVGQQIREEGPQAHMVKRGTPTMGGVLIVGSVLISTLLWAKLSSIYVWTAMIATLLFAAIGFVDDYSKMAKQRSLGLTGRQKLLAQLLVAAGVWAMLFISTKYSWNVSIPFFKVTSDPTGRSFIGPYLYMVLVAVVLLGSSNAVNLTDGLDGLAIVPSMIAASCFALIAYLVGNAIFANYLGIPFVPGAGELAVFCGAMVGASLGFLWFNAPPAMVFMGDTGSLASGGALGAVAVVTKHELVLAMVGGLFVLETVSVIVQVLSFKLTGKRVFRMAPLHHHFEQKGWEEPTIVIRFWIIAVILALIGLSTLKLR
jgi:phospho-N-acetylmuramoyl-pentapeptide-transferase